MTSVACTALRLAVVEDICKDRIGSSGEFRRDDNASRVFVVDE